jgi:hypothetical protein
MVVGHIAAVDHACHHHSVCHHHGDVNTGTGGGLLIMQKIITSFLKAFGVVCILAGLIIYTYGLYVLCGPVITVTGLFIAAIIIFFIIFYKKWI